MKIAVGSKNPVKIEATRIAFQTVWPEVDWNVIGVEVLSGVGNQPMSDLESIKGGTKRARDAQKTVNSDFGIGLEGGLHKIGKQWFDTGWIVVIDRQGKRGIGSTVRIHTPDKMMKLIHEGKELGEVCDIFFNTKNSKQAEGHFGLLTRNAVTRTSAYKDAIIIALAAFIHPGLFVEE